MSSPEKKIVFVAPTWLGDAVMSLPLLGYIATSPDVRMTVLTRDYAARVYWGLDATGDLVVVGGRQRMGRIWAQVKVLRRLGADGAVILAPSFSSAMGPFLARVPVRVGIRSDAREFILTTSLESGHRRDEHLSNDYLELGRALFERLGVRSDHPFTTPRIKVFEGERESLCDIMRRAGVPGGGYAVVVPGATYGSAKSWPPDKYRGLVRRLAMEIPVVLAGSGSEAALCERIGNEIANVHNLAGRTSLGQLFALIDGADVVVANDSGSPHVAASLGVATIVIFGSTLPRWTSPLGENVHVVSEPVHCSPCFLRECPTRLECYEGITVDRVFETTRVALKNGVEKTDSG